MDFSPKGLLTVEHLRFARLWTWLGLSLIFGICFMSLISVPTQVKALMLNDKMMHLFIYGCLMGWFAQIFKHDLARLVLVVFFIAMGVAIEYLQAMVPARQFEVLDMVANTSGVVLAWAVSYTCMGSLLERIERLSIAVFSYTSSSTLAK